MAETTLNIPVDGDVKVVKPQDDENKVYVASQGTLIWWRFRKHRLAVISLVILLIIYFVALFADFFAPTTASDYSAQHQYAPPTPLRFMYTDADGNTQFRLHVPVLTSELNPESLRREYVFSDTEIIPLGFFVRGEPYDMFGLIESDIHFFGPTQYGETMYLMGADRLGRDVLSRMLLGARLSLSVGLVGVAISLFLGILLGGISGYYGGVIDNIIQRIIEFVISLPSIPLWLGLAAALPPTWSIVRVYFFITIILSLRGWTGLARVVRGRFLSLRSQEFVMAARLDGSSQLRIIFKYMLPSFTSHIIATLTLAIPGMILAETALSFLGLGLRPPAVSWGVLLQEAQNVRSVLTAPWLLAPALAVIVSIMAFNFLGDGLRDAADPYSN